MTLVDMVGFSAAAASFVAFSAKTMIPLRIAAICSNALFIAFGLLSGFWLAALMHTLLLPLNVHRLQAMRRLVRRVAVAARADDLFRVRVAAALYETNVFHQGPHDLRKRRARTRRLLHRIGSGAFPGGRRARRVAGCSSARSRYSRNEGRRTLSCVCETDVEVLYMTNEELKELYFQNPEFGFHLVRLIVGRMKRQIDQLQAHVQPT